MDFESIKFQIHAWSCELIPLISPIAAIQTDAIINYYQFYSANEIDVASACSHAFSAPTLPVSPDLIRDLAIPVEGRNRTVPTLLAFRPNLTIKITRFFALQPFRTLILIYVRDYSHGRPQPQLWGHQTVLQDSLGL